ncbi:hypothetical protein chiPu_0030162, partial [Chiloscyllium punctatum]|nr:hypothetical protein [Chiloscyllium punctatum]
MSFRGDALAWNPESVLPRTMRPNGFRVLACGEPRNDESGHAARSILPSPARGCCGRDR